MIGLLASLVVALQQPQDGAADRSALTEPAALKRSEQASARGLRWLAAQQLESGAWVGHVGHKQGDDYVLLRNALSPEQQRDQGRGHIGVTALCGMAFLAGGHMPDRGQYGKQVTRTLDYVIDHVAENGLISDSGTRMYSHAFATLFLAEVHGMADNRKVADALERAVHLIVDCQNEYGGWRYNAFDRECDLSVTVCQVQALRAARNIGIQVPKGTIDRAIDYVLRSRTRSGPSRGLFYYKIHGRGAYEKNREFAINAAALTALHSAGNYDAELSDPVLDFLSRSYVDIADYYPGHYYYWYGNYYACQAFHQVGGPRFEAFYTRLRADLVDSQAADGRWRNTAGPGDEFSTAVACILLQLQKQYLPIFQR